MTSLNHGLYHLGYRWSLVTPRVRWLAVALLAVVAWLIAYVADAPDPKHAEHQIAVATLARPTALPDKAPQMALPELSLSALQDALQALDSPSLTIRDQHYQLSANGGLSELTAFMANLATSSHSPGRYQLVLPDQSQAADNRGRAKAQLTLSLQPGQFIAADQRAFSELTDWLNDADRHEAAHSSTPSNCQSPLPPQLIVTANWPQRDYVVVVYQGQTRRLQLNQVLENSWQLKRIRRDWLEFQWTSQNPVCQQMHRVAVAI
ncbi:hypothetical protein CWE12_09350 [Aliidiomarina sedimenti]|uniref:Secretin/TonB short N-terminal domain-containing protein n=1 Tax=Aliidiomarina sedimenti TaxID=1933879 RepID=A0ABY0BXQ2_9GAMM|nr:hypothetical protein [Aliidiomarina sedimenti]RUO29182.1 hypothetical protein CWE12_09350 [Aliidiomarina sedimenti]